MVLWPWTCDHNCISMLWSYYTEIPEMGYFIKEEVYFGLQCRGSKFEVTLAHSLSPQQWPSFWQSLKEAKEDHGLRDRKYAPVCVHVHLCVCVWVWVWVCVCVWACLFVTSVPLVIKLPGFNGGSILMILLSFWKGSLLKISWIRLSPYF